MGMMALAHTRESTRVVFVPGFMQRAEAWSRSPAGRLRELPEHPARPRRATTLDGGSRRSAAAGAAASSCGYSMGGRLALQAAAGRPRRLPGLVLVGATAGIEDAPERRQRRARRRAAGRRGWRASAIDAVVDSGSARPSSPTSPTRSCREQRAGPARTRPAQLAASCCGRRPGRARARLGPAARASSCRCSRSPASCDAKYSAIAERMARRSRTVARALVADAGHAPQLERPSRGSPSYCSSSSYEHFSEGRRRRRRPPRPGPCGTASSRRAAPGSDAARSRRRTARASRARRPATRARRPRAGARRRSPTGRRACSTGTAASPLACAARSASRAGDEAAGSPPASRSRRRTRRAPTAARTSSGPRIDSSAATGTPTTRAHLGQLGSVAHGCSTSWRSSARAARSARPPRRRPTRRSRRAAAPATGPIASRTAATRSTSSGSPTFTLKQEKPVADAGARRGRRPRPAARRAASG